MNRYGDSLKHSGFRKRKGIGKPIDNARGNGDIFSELACTTIVGTGNTENLTTVAKIHFATPTGRTCAAVNSGIKRDAISDSEPSNVFAESSNGSRGFVSHDDGRDSASRRAIVAVNVTATDAAGGDTD